MENLPENLLQDLRQIIDPEIGVNIVDLGLIYGGEVSPDGIELSMTLTSPVCPMGEMLGDQVKAVLARHVQPGGRTEVKLVWNPPWEPSRMSDSARQQLGWS